MMCFINIRFIYLITRTVEERLALLPNKNKFLTRLPSGLENKPQIIDGFKIENGIINFNSQKVFDEQPSRLMRVFLYAQQRRLQLHPELIQLIRRKIRLVTRQFQKDKNIGETFLQILNERGNVAAYIRQMHEVGLLGKYISEFGKLTNLVQHEFYHQYSLDEHTIVCLEKIDQTWGGNNGIDPFYSELLKKIEKPYLLYLSMILHDIGKGAGAPRGKHASIGADMAYKIGKRLSIDDKDAQTLRLLVENHLLLAEYSQKRNIDDVNEILICAKKIQNEENLKILTILTIADTLGTSESLWNGFKDDYCKLYLCASQICLIKILTLLEVKQLSGKNY
jgi:[protein-PII] uridylyltransferase